MIRRTFIATTLAFATTAIPAGAQVFPSNISGSYTAHGMNADGSKYTGRVTVKENAKGDVAFVWQVGAQTYAGQGTRDARVVTVDWGDTTPVVYVYMANGELHGTWAGGKALERLVRE